MDGLCSVDDEDFVRGVLSSEEDVGFEWGLARAAWTAFSSDVDVDLECSSELAKEEDFSSAVYSYQ